MYKDVTKRVLAVILSLCMVLGMTDFSTLVVRAAATNIEGADVTTTPARYTYDGTAKKPNVEVRVGGKVLKENTDYTIDWGSDEERTNANKEIPYTITGTGEYTGSLTKSFAIQERAIGDGVVVKIGEQIPGGKKLKVTGGGKPVIPVQQGDKVSAAVLGAVEGGLSVTYKDKELKGMLKSVYGAGDTDEQQKKNVDFIYECRFNTAATTNAELILTGMGNFNQLNTIKFPIYNKSLVEDTNAESLVLQDMQYDGVKTDYKPGSIEIKDNATQNVLQAGRDYKVEYKGNTARPGKIQVVITGLGDYVGSSVTKEYRIVKNIETYQDDILVDPIADKTYTGADITLTDGELVIYDTSNVGTGYRTKLIAGTHYRVSSYEQNKVCNDYAKVHIEGIKENGYEGFVTVNFHIVPRNMATVDVKVDTLKDYIYSMKEQTPDVSVAYQGVAMNTDDYDIRYENNTDAGTATVTVTGKNNLTGQKSVYFNIQEKSIAAEDGTISIQVDKSGYDYDGSAKEPKVTVTYTPSGSGSYTLQEEKDYTVVYSNNTSAGNPEKPAKITITGKGNYTGTVEETFVINAVDLTTVNTEVSGIKEVCTYTGEDILQTGIKVTYTYTGSDGLPKEKTLTNGTDYYITYENNREVGEAKVLIHGMNNYKGTIQKTFRIESGDISSSSVTASLEYTTIPFDYTKPKPKVTVRHRVDGKQYTLTEQTGSTKGDYTVEYTYDKDMGDYAGVGTVTVTIKGTGNFKGSVEKTFTITPMVLENNADKIKVLNLKAFETFTGKPVEPTGLELQYNGSQIIDSSNYTMTFSKNDYPGKGIITITATDGSNFSGSIEKSFSIKGDLAMPEETEISSIADQIYTGEPIILTNDALKVTYLYPNPETKKPTVLTLDKDFQLVAYANNTNPGTATVEIEETPDGDYYTSNDISKNFNILQKDINNENGDIPVEVAPIPNQEYTGAAIYPELTVTYHGEKKTLVKDVDYEVVKADEKCTQAGEASITIRGIGCFTGERTISFTIDKRDLSKGTISVAGIDDLRIYKGAPVPIENPVITYTSEDGSLVLTNDQIKYTYECVDHNQVGTAKLIITGDEVNFTGSVEIPYLLKGDLSDTENTRVYVLGKRVYNGKPQELTAEEIQVFYYRQQLVFGEDFTLTYPEDNTNASEAVPITVEGAGDYYIGSNSEPEHTFPIAKKPIGEEDIVIVGMKEEGYTYTGEEILPQKETAADGTPFALQYGELTLQEATEDGMGDYTITVENAVNVVDFTDENITDEQKPTMTITATEGNYTGSRKVIFRINPQSVNIEETVAKNIIKNVDETQQEEIIEQIIGESLRIPYEGTPITFDNLVVTCLDKTLAPYVTDEFGEPVLGSDGKPQVKDYTISYEYRPNELGLSYLVITGHGNYGDVKKIPFMVTGDLANEQTQVADIEPQPYTVGGVTPKVTVTYYGEQHVLVEGEDYELSYKNNENVADDKAEQPPTVIITGKGAFEGSVVTKTFTIVPRDLGIQDGMMTLDGLREEGYPYTGKEVKPDELSTLTLKNNGYPVMPDQYTISYENNINGAKAESENPPYVVITAVEGGNYTGVMKVPFTIVGIPLTDSGIKAEAIADQTYTGEELQPKVKITHGENVLTEGVHYTLSWENNINVAKSTAGSAAPAVIVEGIGNYSATKRVTFNIIARDFKTYESEFEIAIPNQTYTGEAFVPVPVVKNAAGKVLTEGEDYKYSAGTNNINAGNAATITITGMGNYTGSITPKFTILPKNIVDKAIEIKGVADKVYNSKGQTQKLMVIWGEKELAADKDYRIIYKNNVNVGTAMAIIEGIGNYTGSKTLYFKIGQRSLTDAGILIKDIPKQVYTGSALTPLPDIYYQDDAQGIRTKLVNGTDFTVSYANNTKVGANVATVKITGKGNYSGAASATFTIVGNVALAEVSGIPVQNYTGSALKPKPVVKQAGKVLTEGKDYSLSYSNNTNAGTATILITGMNEYGGTKKVTFSICRDISGGLSVVGLGKKYLYTGKPVIPTLGKVSAYGQVLRLNKDYVVSVRNNSNVGTATLTVSGVGYYKGSKTYQFDIVRRSISQCSVSTVSTKTYNGKTHKPVFTVKYGGTTLREGSDYTLVYQNNTMPGTASVIVKGKGNLNGSKIVRFRIRMASMGSARAAAAGDDKIKVSWKKQTAVSGYQIYDSKNKKLAQIKGAGKSSCVVTRLKPGTTYSLKVRSYVIRGGRTYYSDFTSLVKATTKPKAPVITVKSTKSRLAVVSWKKAAGASGYEIYRSTKKTSGFKKIATTSKRSYTNKKLTGNKRYYYKVRAYRTVSGKKIYSSYSSVKYVTIKK